MEFKNLKIISSLAFFCISISINAQKIEVENETLSKGLKVEKCNEGGKSVGYIKHGSTILIKKKNLKKNLKAITIRVASINEGSKIQVFSGNIKGKPLTTIKVPKTGGWQKWKSSSSDFKKKIKGKQDIYLKFVGRSKFLCNINYAEFK